MAGTAYQLSVDIEIELNSPERLGLLQTESSRAHNRKIIGSHSPSRPTNCKVASFMSEQCSTAILQHCKYISAHRVNLYHRNIALLSSYLSRVQNIDGLYFLFLIECLSWWSPQCAALHCTACIKIHCLTVMYHRCHIALGSHQSGHCESQLIIFIKIDSILGALITFREVWKEILIFHWSKIKIIMSSEVF